MTCGNSEINMLSVIVPVYKTEQFLRKCLDSIVNQTYKNLQIILVDDGSPDNCGVICDEYAEIDNRVYVIHKNNGGVSSARNVGIEHAKGDYIAFMDSDDWLEENMYEEMLAYAKTENADVVCCNYQYRELKNQDTQQTFQFYGSDACLKMLKSNCLFDGISVVPFDKIFRRETIGRIRFCEQCSYAEDILFVTEVLCKSTCVLKVDKTLYHYVQVEGSAMNSDYRIQRSSEIIALEKCIKIAKKYGLDDLKKVFVSKYFSAALHHWEECDLRKEQNEFKIKMDEIKRQIVGHYRTYHVDLTIREKVKFAVFVGNNSAYCWLKKKLRHRR